MATQSDIALISSNPFVIKKEHGTRPSYLKSLPNHFTDDISEARKFATETAAKNNMLKITTYSLNPKYYSIIRL